MTALKRTIVLGILFCILLNSQAQLTITPHSSPAALAQNLVGNGITISNVTYTGNPQMSGFFSANNNTVLGITDGIVLTNGRAKTDFLNTGTDNNGFSTADAELADNSWGLPGDLGLANAINYQPDLLEDACVLEFDFIPLGDSISFRYVFSSEEYTALYACPGGIDFNDAFAFFISGPGFPAPRNIALVPNTTLPVSIFNINNVTEDGLPLCPNNPTYFVDNTSNLFFTHDGHTVVLTASARVQPCQTYHMKLVISDVGDDLFDSGVFLEEGSLSSNILQLNTFTQVDTSGVNYLVEGCLPGSVKIKRQAAAPVPLLVNLAYSGTAINGTDVQLLPPSVTIPPGSDEVTLNIIPIVDNLPEGTETITISLMPPCGSTGPALVTTTIELKDYDTLSLWPGQHPDTAFICRNTSIQLNASDNYAFYTWDANSTLTNTTIPDPVATPTASFTKYYCRARVGSCYGRDSLNVKWKEIWLQSKTDVSCAQGTTGRIAVTKSTGWQTPVEYRANNGAWQASPIFNNLAVGTYVIKIKDASGCTDSVSAAIIQTHPDLLIQRIDTTFASCTGNADGKIIITPTGGRPAYQYSINNGINYQASNTFNVRAGSYSIKVKDQNGCTIAQQNVEVALKNDIILSMGSAPVICEGTSSQPLPLTSDASTHLWWPSGGISNVNIKNPVANPTQTTRYYVKGTRGICTKTDSILVIVNPAPVPNAGQDKVICFGGNTTLNGSGGTEYFWRPGIYLDDVNAATPNIIDPLDDRVYYLGVKDANGCQSLFEDTVKLHVTPPVRIFAGYDTIAAIGQPVQLHTYEIANSGVTRYTWEPAYGLDDPNSARPVAILDKEVIYYVTGYTDANCKGSAVVKVKVYKGPDIYVPKAFTPNGDGLNDLLKGIPVGLKETHFFKVYNRWGQEVFSTREFHKGWNGRFRNSQVVPGTYTWIAQGIDYLGRMVTRKGTVIIIL
ncbi:MAG: choice-of-anchor L domain-containing protein [Ferruginibacter sp.]